MRIIVLYVKMNSSFVNILTIGFFSACHLLYSCEIYFWNNEWEWSEWFIWKSVLWVYKVMTSWLLADTLRYRTCWNACEFMFAWEHNITGKVLIPLITFFIYSLYSFTILTHSLHFFSWLSNQEIFIPVIWIQITLTSATICFSRGITKC